MAILIREDGKDVKKIEEEFTNKYSLTKTLRFELKPIGKTLEHIEHKGLISQDEERAKSFKEMKKCIDAFHKNFIEQFLPQVELTHLNEFAELYNATGEHKKEDEYRKKFAKLQDELRKEIANIFKTGQAKEIYSNIDKKKLITKLLPNWKRTQEEQDICSDDNFKNFTTYFKTFLTLLTLSCPRP